MAVKCNSYALDLSHAGARALLGAQACILSPRGFGRTAYPGVFSLSPLTSTSRVFESTKNSGVVENAKNSGTSLFGLGCGVNLGFPARVFQRPGACQAVIGRSPRKRACACMRIHTRALSQVPWPFYRSSGMALTRQSRLHKAPDVLSWAICAICEFAFCFIEPTRVWY